MIFLVIELCVVTIIDLVPSGLDGLFHYLTFHDRGGFYLCHLALTSWFNCRFQHDGSYQNQLRGCPCDSAGAQLLGKLFSCLFVENQVWQILQLSNIRFLPKKLSFFVNILASLTNSWKVPSNSGLPSWSRVRGTTPITDCRNSS